MNGRCVLLFDQSPTDPNCTPSFCFRNPVEDLGSESGTAVNLLHGPCVRRPTINTLDYPKLLPEPTHTRAYANYRSSSSHIDGNLVIKGKRRRSWTQ